MASKRAACKGLELSPHVHAFRQSRYTPSPVPIAAAVDDSSAGEEDVPDGAVRFELEAPAIEEALAEIGVEVEALEDVDVSRYHRDTREIPWK